MVHRTRRNERGFSTIFVALGLAGFVGTTALAIDVGMFMTARSQAQNAADAGALAGATALAFDSYTNHAADGPAVQNAVQTALANKVMSKPVSVGPADVAFLDDGTGQLSRVQVSVYRTGARGNAVSTLMGSFFGLRNVDISATATAEASPANAMTCVKPFMIPDKWIERQTPAWDPGDSFDMFDNHGNLLAKPDIYVPANVVPGYTGYTVQNDVGTQLVLRAGTGTEINPSFYYSWKMPGDTGGSFYRDNIENCNPSVITWGTPMVQEPGNMSGPTIQGITTLINKDLGAYWDVGCQCVKGSAYGNASPRVFPIPLYDPAYYAEGKANGRPADFKIANFLGFFADHVSGNQIYGIITNIVGVVDPNQPPAPAGSFARSIRLVH